MSSSLSGHLNTSVSVLRSKKCIDCKYFVQPTSKCSKFAYTHLVTFQPILLEAELVRRVGSQCGANAQHFECKDKDTTKYVSYIEYDPMM